MKLTFIILKEDTELFWVYIVQSRLLAASSHSLLPVSVRDSFDANSNSLLKSESLAALTSPNSIVR